MVKETKPVPLRRSSRVNVLTVVRVSGTFPDGKSFSEDAHIVTISKYGAKLRIQQPLQVGMEVKVQPRRRREPGLFRVVWVGREGTPREGEVGIECLQVSNLLGISFPE